MKKKIEMFWVYVCRGRTWGCREKDAKEGITRHEEKVKPVEEVYRCDKAEHAGGCCNRCGVVQDGMDRNDLLQ